MMYCLPDTGSMSALQDPGSSLNVRTHDFSILREAKFVQFFSLRRNYFAFLEGIIDRVWSILNVCGCWFSGRYLDNVRASKQNLMLCWRLWSSIEGFEWAVLGAVQFNWLSWRLLELHDLKFFLNLFIS